MERPVIVSDVDGVLAWFSLAFGRLLKLKHPELPPRVWNWMDELADPERVELAWRQVRRSTRWWLGVPALAWTAETLVRLNHHDTWYVTSRVGRRVQDQTTKWLARHGARDPRVIAVREPREKVDVAAELRAGLLLEDDPDVALAALPYVRFVCLIDWPYNRWAQGVRRVTTPLEALDFYEAATQTSPAETR